MLGWRTDFSAASGFQFERIEVDQLGPSTLPPLFPMPLRVDERDGSGWQIEIGLWFFAFAYLLIWLGMVCWWQRRKGRLSTPTIPAA